MKTEGHGFTDPEPFKSLPHRTMLGIHSALKDLLEAQEKKDGPAASRAADRLCELAMKAEGHFFFMRRRACHYIEEL